MGKRRRKKKMERSARGGPKYTQRETQVRNSNVGLPVGLEGSVSTLVTFRRQKSFDTTCIRDPRCPRQKIFRCGLRGYGRHFGGGGSNRVLDAFPCSFPGISTGLFPGRQNHQMVME